MTTRLVATAVIAAVALLLAATGCAGPAPSLAGAAASDPSAQKAASKPTLVATTTATPSPTATRTPVPTRTSTPTFEPAPEVNAESVDSTLRAHGYKRYPAPGENGYTWDNGSEINFYTSDDVIAMTMLYDSNNSGLRHALIDEGIDIIAPLLADGAVAELREEAHGYADHFVMVSGEPEILDHGEEPWVGKLMEFNRYETSIRNGGEELPLGIRLLYREYKCDMTRYLYCYYSEMPSMTFTGGDTLTTLNVWIVLR